MSDYETAAELPTGWSLKRVDSVLRLYEPQPDASRGPERYLSIDWNDRRTRAMVSGGRSHPLYRAVGLDRRRGCRIVDATGGLGVDAFLLGCLGATVTVIERDPAIYALLDDAWQRAGRPAHTQPVAADATDWLRERFVTPGIGHSERAVEPLKDARKDARASQPRPEVIYLDPMFPATRKSAAPRGDIALMRAYFSDRQREFGSPTERSPDDAPTREAADLLAVALESADWRVVVKRSPTSQPIPGRAPDASTGSKLVRYDLYQSRSGSINHDQSR